LELVAVSSKICPSALFVWELPVVLAIAEKFIKVFRSL
jgi:hypothetical protein